MRQPRRKRVSPSLLLLLLLVLATSAGCPLQPSAAPRTGTEAASAGKAPDVRKHLVGPWWRAHRGRAEGIDLRSDGKLSLSGVPYLRGSAWRVAGRSLHVRLRDEESGLIYEDELYIRRLTDRTLIIEAGDSYFSGTYQRDRDAIAIPRGAQPAAAAAAPATAAATGPTWPEETATTQRDGSVAPIFLRAVAADDVTPRGGWLTVLADLAACDQQLNSSLCPRFYLDDAADLLAIEVCQPGRSLPEGLHFIDARGLRASFPWFDPGFGRFYCDNGCRSPEGCRYEVVTRSAGGRPHEVIHRFEIGAMWGWVRLRLGADGDVQVIGREIRTPQ